DTDKGAQFTWAMHEDTQFYFVHKGRDLKGYVGFVWGKDKKGRKVLAIDTIQSPSLDGEDLLMNLFKALNDFALEEGAVGIALPSLSSGKAFELGERLKEAPSFSWKFLDYGTEEKELGGETKGKGIENWLKQYGNLGIEVKWSLSFHASNQEGRGDFYSYLD